MNDVESNIQAYRIMAEVLVNLRRIMVRGLRKAVGESWWETGCPPEVFQRLNERREIELAIERTAVETEDLMAFASFGDMAEIVDQNDALARLLQRLAPSRQFLSARMSELEILRVKLASARPLTEEEFRMLTNYNMKLHELLVGGRGRPRTDRSGSENGQRTDGEVAPSSEEAPTPARKAPRKVAPVTPPPDLAPAPVEDVPGEEDAVVPSAPREGDGIDDTETLQKLRQEIVAAAGAAFQHAEQVDMGEWQKLRDSGWFRQRVRELEPIVAFYETIEEHQKLGAEGATPLELDGFLARTGLSGMLLELRELFLRLGV